MKVVVNNISTKQGAQGVWYTADVAVGRREYKVNAVRLDNMISVFSCKSMDSGREANRRGTTRKLIEGAIVKVVGATMTAEEFLEQSPIASEDL